MEKNKKVWYAYSDEELSKIEEKVDLMMNNINSYPRAQYHGKSAYEMFVFLYGQELANKLGLKEVPKNQVTLKPELI